MLAPDNGVRLALRNGHKSEHALTAVVALSQSISQLFSHFKFDFLARCCLPFCSPSAALQRPFLCRCTVIPESRVGAEPPASADKNAQPRPRGASPC